MAPLLHHLAFLAADELNPLTSSLFAAGMILVMLSIFMAFRKTRRRKKHQPTAHEQVERSREARAMRGDLEQLMVEIEQLAKRMSAQLDNKSVQLQRLIREADQRIEQLDGRQGPAEPTPSEPTLASEADRLKSRVRRVSAPTDRPADDPPAELAEPGNSSDLNAEVCRLADHGLTAQQIAQKLNEHVGKIELVLALRQSS